MLLAVTFSSLVFDFVFLSLVRDDCSHHACVHLTLLDWPRGYSLVLSDRCTWILDDGRDRKQFEL